MKRQHTYEELIGQKLNGLTAPDVASLWSNMEAILDKEMPQQETKPRVAAWWQNANLLIAASLLVAVGSLFTFNRLSTHDFVAAGNNRVEGNRSAAIKSPLGTQTAKAENGATAATKAAKQQTVVAVTEDVAKTAEPKAIKTTTVSDVVLNKAGKPVKNNAAIIGVAGNKLVAPTKAAMATADVQTPAVSQVAVATALAENKPAQTEATGAGQITAALTEAQPVAVAAPGVFSVQNVNALSNADMSRKLGKVKRAAIYIDKGVSFGVALNHALAVNGQQANALDINGKDNKWQDYVPSVYAQLHLSSAFYVQAEWQPVTTQYTPNYTLYHKTDVPSPDEKEETIVKLNKLFYTSIPVSVHYNTPLKGVSLGAGLQYSLLKKIVLQDQYYYQIIGPGRWDTVSSRDVVAAKNPDAVRNHSSGEAVDEVARSFKKADWRLLADVGYTYKGFNAGVRYTRGLRDYINTNFTNLPVKARNESVQVYLRYNIFDSRKK